jgi:NAD(P)-dependent dehydrogenase (short-subunit alcohol dehydrogenase family)
MPAPTALITGGTTGIGHATAELLHDRGYRVMVTGQNPDTIAQARQTLPPDVIVTQADARSLADAGRVASEVGARVGALNLLFLNAGISRPAPVDAWDETTYDDVFAVNTKGQFFTLQGVLPLLAEAASIVFTVGIGVSRGMPGGSVTAASRGALLSMVPSLAIELAPRHIRVNAVSPGAIDTPIWTKSGMAPDAQKQVADTISARIPLGRFGAAFEVAEVVAFLGSDASRYVTGQNIVVGGGIDVV